MRNWSHAPQGCQSVSDPGYYWLEAFSIQQLFSCLCEAVSGLSSIPGGKISTVRGYFHSWHKALLTFASASQGEVKVETLLLPALRRIPREEMRRRRSVGKTPLLITEHSGEEFGPERPRAREMHRQGWQSIAQKSLGGAQESKETICIHCLSAAVCFYPYTAFVM